MRSYEVWYRVANSNEHWNSYGLDVAVIEANSMAEAIMYYYGQYCYRVVQVLPALEKNL